MSGFVLVSVGTDHHPFDRLLNTVSAWCRSHPNLRLIAQHGYSQPAIGAENHAFIARVRLLELMETATLVVTQVGPGTVLDANGAGRRPIALPRDPTRGEHVDGHQQAFAAVLHARGAAIVARDEREMTAALDAALEDLQLTRMPPRSSPAPQTAARLGLRLAELRAQNFAAVRWRRIWTSLQPPSRLRSPPPTQPRQGLM